MSPASPSPRRLFARVRPSPGGSGFSLVELLTAITVIAILSTITIGAIRGAKERSHIVRTRSELAALVTALEEFKRLYGDYPQTGALQQAPVTPTGESATNPKGTGPGLNTPQARLFNCLTGVYGARPDARGNWVRLNGPNLIDVGKFSIAQEPDSRTFLTPTNLGGALAKQEQNTCFLDPWGRRYLYYYKNPGNPNAWQATSYVLYSAGRLVAANGTQTPPITVTSGLLLATPTPEMADNIYANP